MGAKYVVITSVDDCASIPVYPPNEFGDSPVYITLK